jgi:SAM-dependent methyltransferase
VTSSTAPGAAECAYAALADHYDVFTAHHDYELWIGRLLRLARVHGLSGERVLDVGCGTGKSFLPLLDRDYAVVGCDLSQPMLEIAATKVGGGVPLHCVDARQLPVLGEFDLVTCLDDVVNYLTDPGALTAAFGGIARNLNPGGLVIFDTNTLATYRGFFRETIVVETPDSMLIWRGLATEAFSLAGLARARVDIFSRGPQEWVRAVSAHEQRHHPDHVIRGALDAAGLRCLAVYAQDPAVNFDRRVDERTHTKSIYLATTADPTIQRG